MAHAVAQINPTGRASCELEEAKTRQAAQVFTEGASHALRGHAMHGTEGRTIIDHAGLLDLSYL